LHVIAPYSEPSSRAMLGLLKIVTQRLPKKHNVIVLGDADLAIQLRMQDFSVLGSVQGITNNSHTLGMRVRRAVEAVTTRKDKLIAWGWTPTIAISGIDCVHQTVAYVDSIDATTTPTIEVDCVIPTTWTCSDRLKENKHLSHLVTEPLVGIDAKSLVVDPTSVLRALNISRKTLLVAVVNDIGMWEEIVAFIVQMKALGEEIALVVSNNYLYYAELHFALQEHGLVNSLHQVAQGLRLIDVAHVATCIWAPSSTVHGKLEGVLDVLSASASGVPVAASHKHAVSGVPTIGNRIAWVTSVSELGAWVMALWKESSDISDQGLELAARLRSIASPSRFVEGLQLRLQ
jgi:hypothetical protein